jgi:hypothetical protein
LRLVAAPLAVLIWVLALLSCTHESTNLSDCSDSSRFCPEAGVCCTWGTSCGQDACTVDGGPEDSPEDYFYDWEDVEVNTSGTPGCNGIGCGGSGTGGGPGAGGGYGRM